MVRQIRNKMRCSESVESLANTALFIVYCQTLQFKAYQLFDYKNKMLGRAQDPRANGSWLSKLTE